MSASDPDQGLRDASPKATGSALACAVAVTATLLAAALAAAPAWGQDAAGAVPPTIADSPSSGGNDVVGGVIGESLDPGDTTVQADDQSTSSATQSNSATNTQTTTTTGGNGGTATGGEAGPSQVAGDGSRGSSHGGDAYANGGDAKSYSNLDNEQSNQVSGRDHSDPGLKGDNQGGQGTSVVDGTKLRDSGGATLATQRVPFGGFLALGVPGRAGLGTDPSVHQSGAISPLGGSLRSRSNRLPGQNPFLNLLRGLGGADAALPLLILLAVLTASFALPNRRPNAFRMPAAVWTPPAYIPPIELPG